MELPACGLVEIGCHVNNAVSTFLISTIGAMGDFTVDMIGGAFSSTNPSTTTWSITAEQFGVWFAIAAILMIALGLIQLIPAVLLQQGTRVVGIVVAIVVGPVLSILALRYAPGLVTWSSLATSDVLSGLTGEDFGDMILRVLGWGSRDEIASGPPAWAMQTGGIGPLLLAVLIIGLMCIAAMVLFLSMAMRTFMLIVLVAFAPAALMFVGQPIMKDMVMRWFQLFFALLLAQPLAAGVIVLAVRIAANSGGGEVGLLLIASASVFFAALSPFWSMSLVSFAAAGVDSAMERRVDSGGRAGGAGRRAVSVVARKVLK